MSESVSRRKFLQDTLSLLALSAAPVQALGASPKRRKPYGANEKVRIAVLGVHGRGLDHTAAYLAMPDVDVIAICDPDTATWDRAVKMVEKSGRPTPKTYQDIRKLLEDKTLDAVSIATPNHWHSLAAIWAMQAGKDVYVEKPVSHNVAEGWRMVEWTRHTKRICQAGTQCRSSKGLQEAMQWLHEGNLGKIHLARGLCYKRRDSIGYVTTPQPPPPTVDYDIWLGPAPYKPVMRKRFHYDWHWFWDYGNGDLGNQGPHEMDKARWALNKTEFPKTVLGLGGRFGYKDNGQTPNTMLALMDYGDCKLIFEVRGLKTEEFKVRNIPAGAYIGDIIYGEKGVMVNSNYSSATAYDYDGNLLASFNGGGNHFRNFIDAVRSQDPSILNAEIEVGYLSTSLNHLPNISYLLGKPTPFQPMTSEFNSDKDALETLNAFSDHLAANGINLEDSKYFLGPSLRIGRNAERIEGNNRANSMLSASHRSPFSLPAKPKA